MNENKLLTPLKITVFHKDSVHLEKTFEKYPIIIGRSKKCDVVLSDFEFLSRQHCVINMNDGVLQILDLESANGIYQFGSKIKKIPLDQNTEVTVGDLKLQIEFQTVIISHSHTAETITEKAMETPKVIPSLPKIPNVSLQKALEQKAKVAETKKASEATQTKTSSRETIKTKVPSVDAKVKKTEKPKSIPSIQSPVQSPVQSSAQPQVPFKAPSSHGGSGLSFIKPHHHAAQLRPNQRVLESFVTWKDQIYESHQFYAGSQVVVGSGEGTNVEVPTLKFALPLAFYDGNTTHCVIPQSLNFSIQNEHGFIEKKELLRSGQISNKNNNVAFKMGPSDVVTVDIGTNMAVHFRYGPAPRLLSRTMAFMEDRELRKTTALSGVAHFILLISILLTEPKSKAPVIKNVPERYARLLVKKPEPIKPPPPVPKKPEPPKKQEVAKREQPKKQPRKQPVVKKQVKPVKVVKLQPSKVLKRVNRYPVEVDRPMKVAEKPVVANIQAVGALAALNAFSSKVPPTDQPVAININKNAGGQTALNTGGVIGALKTNTGKLAAGGLASVKTKGLGYGTGTGYGVQGIKGTAGGRAVAGTVVGAPSLVNLSKEDGLTRAQVMDVVKRYMSNIQQCYERSLIDNPNISGRAEYEWEITPKGGVVWAKVKKSEMSGADSLNNCVTGVFKKMKFPVAKNGQNTIPNIGFPFGRL